MKTSDLISTVNTVVMSIALIVGLVTAYYAYLGQRIQELGDARSLPSYRRQLSSSDRSQLYDTLLEAALDRADRIFGTPFSWRALQTCFIIAFFYPVVLFLVNWGIHGSGMLGTYEAMPLDWPLWKRMTFLIGVFAWTLVTSLSARYSDRFSLLVDRLLKPVFERGPWKRRSSQIPLLTRRKIAGPLLGVVIGFATYLVADSANTGVAFGAALSAPVAFAGDFPGSGAFSIGVPFTFLLLLITTEVGLGLSNVLPVLSFLTILAVAPPSFAFWNKRLVYLGLTLATAGLIVTQAYKGEGWDLESVSVAVFLLGLPVVNAAFDFVSWAVSRCFGRLLLRHSWTVAIFLVIADLILALALLAGLVWTLSACTSLLNQEMFGVTQGSFVDVAAVISSVRDEPFGTGMWVTAMIASTLIPTLIHIGLALGSAVVLKPTEKQQAWLARIDAVLADQTQSLSHLERRRIARHLLLHRAFIALVLSLLVIGVVVVVLKAADLPRMLLRIAVAGAAIRNY